MTSTFKRLREESFFSGAFVVFRHISDFFRIICLVVMRNFVYLQTVKGSATICPPYYINVNELKISRKVLNLSVLSFALRKLECSSLV